MDETKDGWTEKSRILNNPFDRCSKFYLAKKVSSSLTTFDRAIMIISVMMRIVSQQAFSKEIYGMSRDVFSQTTST